MKRRPLSLAERKPVTLDYFSEERAVLADSAMWQVISRWQREGLVRLTWGESAHFAKVVLTAAGQARVAGGKA